MTISYNWLKQYVHTTLSAEEAAEILTSIGLEVEALEKIETIKGGLAGVVVGEVLTCTMHPDSDHLHITTVNLGTGDPVQIVCGASNVASGQRVMVATVGAVLHPINAEEEFKIKKSKIRGVESFGMICAEDELGVGEDHAGIMVLPADTPVGMAAKEYFKIEDDYVMEIGLTPNRVDAASHIGVARDLIAYLQSNGGDQKLLLPSVEAFKVDKIDRPIAVTVEDGAAAPHYMGITIRGIQVKSSPDWLQNRLRALGLNPHNNIVDITNFILHELGQPLHAFDADKISGERVVVKCCQEGTQFKTLDGVDRKLSDKDLMICNMQRPMCIAGVFGGMDSGVTNETQNVFIESAYFNPVSIRKTAKRHGLSTDASFRYERGTDPLILEYALKRCALLIKELAGGTIASEIVDECAHEAEYFHVDVNYAHVNRLVGKEIPAEKVKAIVRALEMQIEHENEAGIRLLIPPYRVDVQREADVIEDILRIYGYNNIEIPEHVNSTLAYAPRPDKDRLVNRVAEMLTANGFNEIMSNSLTKASYYENLASYKTENCVRIINPLSNDLNVMRQTLMFNSLETVQLNVNHKNSDLKLYEFGNCYFYDPHKEVKAGNLEKYSEEYRLALTVTGNDTSISWNSKQTLSDFYTLKKFAEKILSSFGVNVNDAQVETLSSDLYREAVSYSYRGKKLFEIGVVAKKIRNIFDLKQEVYFLEMNFGFLLKMTKGHKITVHELTKYPEVRRDLALLVDKHVTFGELRDLAFKVDKKLLKHVALFDVYEGDKLPEGKKSYALSFTLQDETKTLNDSVIDKIMTNLIAQYDRQLGAKIRE